MHQNAQLQCIQTLSEDRSVARLLGKLVFCQRPVRPVLAHSRPTRLDWCDCTWMTMAPFICRVVSPIFQTDEAKCVFASCASYVFARLIYCDHRAASSWTSAIFWDIFNVAVRNRPVPARCVKDQIKPALAGASAAGRCPWLFTIAAESIPTSAENFLISSRKWHAVTFAFYTLLRAKCFQDVDI